MLKNVFAMRRFIWRSARGYHLLLHALGRAPGQGGSTQGASGLAYSRDGLDWSWVAGSDGDGGGRPVYSPNITWSDGSADGLTRRQAPYLFFSLLGGRQDASDSSRSHSNEGEV